MPNKRWWNRWYLEIGEIFGELPEPERKLILKMAEHIQPGQSEEIQKMIAENIRDVARKIRYEKTLQPPDETQEFLRLLGSCKGKKSESP